MDGQCGTFGPDRSLEPDPLCSLAPLRPSRPGCCSGPSLVLEAVACGSFSGTHSYCSLRFQSTPWPAPCSAPLRHDRRHRQRRVAIVKVGCLAGAGTGLVLGLALLAAVLLAPARPPPFGPGQPINPAAEADEEQTLERDYLRWMAEQDQGERGGLILFFVLPVTLCAITSPVRGVAARAATIEVTAGDRVKPTHETLNLSRGAPIGSLTG